MDQSQVLVNKEVKAQFDRMINIIKQITLDLEILKKRVDVLEKK